MRQYALAVLERKTRINRQFHTEPYETAWATEAIFFLRVEQCEGKNAVLNARVQLSADGIRWVDEGTVFPSITAAEDYFVRVRHFGGWLRLAGTIGGEEAAFVITVQLSLKE